MAGTVKTPAEIRADKLAEIERINRNLTRGIKKVREEDREIEHVDPKYLIRRRDELLAETGGVNETGPEPTARVRQIRMIGRKGY
ncbi:MAG: hypothetical protein Q7T93_16575 [Methylobacterium sp.]|uniref:hypothetical protein n=1 Tax=Methylobacterium sp. TaxID=409 RepID=UPI0027290206|nr:hypothetical protein [Methylobacterium sp.]MDO9428433.1 hypothetical protein [Methylobacterium sp.]